MSGASRPNCATASRPSCAVAAMRQPCAAQSIERASAPKTAGSLSTSITLYIMSCLRSVAWGSRVRLFPVCVPVSAAGQRPKNRAGSPSGRRGKLPQTDKTSRCPHRRREKCFMEKERFFCSFLLSYHSKTGGEREFFIRFAGKLRHTGNRPNRDKKLGKNLPVLPAGPCYNGDRKAAAARRHPAPRPSRPGRFFPY